MDKNRPVLSFCFTGRNDDYFGDYKYRVSSCLNLLCKGLEALGKLDAAEIIVSDWGSDVPLARVLRLHPRTRRKVKFLHTPPEVARRIHDDPILPNGLATNAAFRRAEGEFISYWDSDILLTHSSLRALFDVLEGKVPGVPHREVFWFANRRHLPLNIVNKKPSLREIEEYLARNAAYLVGETLGTGYGAGSTMLMHRDLVDATRAVDERMRWWGWTDVDLALRCNQRHPTLDLSSFGVLPVHQEHYTSRLADSDKELGERKFNLPDCNPAYTQNDENWGLAREALVFLEGEVEDDENAPDRTDRVGTAEPWTMTRQQLATHLGDPKNQAQIQPILQAVRVDSRELNALQALAWYARTRGVITFVEMGIQFPQAFAVVAHNAPGVEVHGLHAFFNRGPGPETGQPVESCNYFATCAFQCIVGLRHFGRPMCYVRFTGGNPRQAVANLARSAVGRFAYDLALIRCGPGIPYEPEQAVELSRYVRPGGMIVVYGENPLAFQEYFEAVKQANPQFANGHFQDGHTGVLLAATLADGV